MGALAAIQRLIRVEHQDPPARARANGAIAGGREIDDREIERDHFRPVTGRDAWRCIRRTGVDDDQFAGQIPHRIETPGKVALFVLHNHAQAQSIVRSFSGIPAFIATRTLPISHIAEG